MPESNLPEGTATDDAAPVDAVKAIEDLIDLDEPNLEEDGAEPEQEAGPDDVEIEQQEADGPDEVGKGGKFVSNDAKVTLNDGTVITVQELKRGFLSQQSFTRSTQEVSETRKALESEKATVAQTAQAISQQRDFLLQAAQKFLPKAPDRELMQSDPFGYMQARAEYDEKMQVVNQLLYQSQSEKHRLTQEEQRALDDKKAEEARKLFEVVPEFRDRKVYDQFWTDATAMMAEHYGFTPEELSETTDHRLYKAMRDLVKYQKALTRAKTVNKDIQQKPQLMSGGRRMDTKAKTSREAKGRADQLRKSGSFEDGINALMDHV